MLGGARGDAFQPENAAKTHPAEIAGIERAFTRAGVIRNLSPRFPRPNGFLSRADRPALRSNSSPPVL